MRVDDEGAEICIYFLVGFISDYIKDVETG